MTKLYKTLWIIIVLLMATVGLARGQAAVSGVVKDETGSTIPGANIVVKGTTNGITSDANGAFSIQASPSDVLIISFIGFKPQEIQVGSKTSILVSLESDITTLNEVVVVGYGTQLKKDVTGALSTVSAKDFEAQPITRLDQALQGRTPGVQITNVSGSPGGDVKIRIRGSNSISGGNEPLYVVDGFIGADFKNINPDDIESIQILKDASATAIYGSRGANGVILISTKKGTSNKGLGITFTSRYTSSSVIKKYDLLSAASYAETVNERNAALGLAPTYTPEQINGYKTNGGTDWQNEIFRNASGNEQLLNISGGKDKTNFFVSGNYLDQDGVILNSGYKRYGFRTNINSSLNDKISVRFNFSGMRRENLNGSGTTAKSGPITQALAWAPTTPAYDAAGNYTLKDPVGSIFQNPLALANEIKNQGTATVGNLLGGINFEIIEGLTFDMSLGMNYDNSQYRGFTGLAASGNNTASASRSSSENILLQNINNLTYHKVFNDIHNLTVTGVFEMQSFKSSSFSASASNLTYPALEADNLSNINPGGVQTTAAGYSNSGLRSFLGRVNYSLKEKYLFTASIRQDASSKFKGANQTSVFPSFGLGWRLSEESFIKNLGLFNNLKLRAGYGVTGNQGIAPYGTYSNYNSDAYSASTPFTNGVLTSGIVLGNPGNPDLKWETTAQTNVGLDVELKQGISFGFDYFQKNTSDLLLYKPVPSYAGGGVVASNVGSVKNHGIEIYVSAVPIKSNDFNWETSFNWSLIKNEVVSLGGEQKLFTGSNVGSGLSTQSEFVLIPGQSMGSIWGVNYLGTWKGSESATAALFGAKPGDSKYEDLDGDNAITSKDFKIIGSAMPKYSIGWNNTFNYKGLSLNIFLQGLSGFDKLNYSYGVSVQATADARQATHVDVLGHYVTGTNENSDIPAFSGTDKSYTQSSRFVQRGDFIRVKNISLSYALPQELLKVVKVKLFFTATNLFTITKYKGLDPESSSVSSGTDTNIGIDYGSYPNSKSYTAGVTLKF